jgi:chitodextrinase
MSLKVSYQALEDLDTPGDCSSRIISYHYRYFTGPPQTPTALTIVDRTNLTITLQWISQFSGADNQTFLLDINGKRILEVADLGNNRTVPYTVTDLQPKTEYQFRVRSRKSLNLYSDYTPEIIVKTKGGQH